MFQMGGIGPMLGQAHHFRVYAPEKIPYAIDRYTNEANRLYGVIDKRLARAAVSSPATTPSPTWRSSPGCASWERQGVNMADYPEPEALVRQHRRPARGAARRRGAERSVRPRPMDEKQKEILFGATQYAKR